MSSIFSDHPNRCDCAFNSRKLPISISSTTSAEMLKPDVFIASILANHERVDNKINVYALNKYDCMTMTDDCIPGVLSSIVNASKDDQVSVSSISFRNHAIGDAGAKSFVDIIPKTFKSREDEENPATMTPKKHNIKLEHLDLSGNNIEADGCTAICEAIKKNSYMRSLNLSCNPLGKGGGYAIAEMLEGNISLQSLSCGDSEMTMDNLIAIMSVMRRNELVESLHIPNCRTFSLQEDLAKQTSRMLEFNSNLIDLNFDRNNVGDEGAVLFANVLQRKNSSLKRLSLAANHIGVRGAESLASALIRGTNLESLDLSNNRIGNDGAMAFGSALTRNKQLRSLNLKYNSVGDEGLAEIAVGMNENSSLSDLMLWGNKFGGASSREFLNLLESRFEYFGVRIDFLPFVVDGEYQVAETSAEKTVRE